MQNDCFLFLSISFSVRLWAYYETSVFLFLIHLTFLCKQGSKLSKSSEKNCLSNKIRQIDCNVNYYNADLYIFIYIYIISGNRLKEPPPPAGFLTQCYLLYKRQLLSLKRDYSLLMARLICHLLIGVIFGYLYMGSGYRANVLANYVYLYGSLLLLVYTGKMAVTLACK